MLRGNQTARSHLSLDVGDYHPQLCESGVVLDKITANASYNTIRDRVPVRIIESIKGHRSVSCSTCSSGHIVVQFDTATGAMRRHQLYDMVDKTFVKRKPEFDSPDARVCNESTPAIFRLREKNTVPLRIHLTAIFRPKIFFTSVFSAVGVSCSNRFNFFWVSIAPPLRCLSFLFTLFLVSICPSLTFNKESFITISLKPSSKIFFIACHKKTVSRSSIKSQSGGLAVC